VQRGGGGCGHTAGCRPTSYHSRVAPIAREAIKSLSAMHSVANCRISLQGVALGAVAARACNMRVVANQSFARICVGTPTPGIVVHMNETLRSDLLPRPKCGRPLSAAPPAPPAALGSVYPNVLRRERMAVSARRWHLTAPGSSAGTRAVGGDADRFGFGCFKARPRYHSEDQGLRRIISRGTPGPTIPFDAELLDLALLHACTGAAR
jgi:hypothetical protein